MFVIAQMRILQKEKLEKLSGREAQLSHKYLEIYVEIEHIFFYKCFHYGYILQIFTVMVKILNGIYYLLVLI